MSKASEIEAKAETLITPIVESNNFELVDVEYVKEGGNYFLRAYIDKPGGINIDDCEKVSRAFSEILDKEDYIEEEYILEISSPGLGRPLKKEKDFIRYKGSEVEVKLYKPLGETGVTYDSETGLNQKELKALTTCKELTGLLGDFDEKYVEVIIDEHTNCKIERSNLALIRLALDF